MIDVANLLAVNFRDLPGCALPYSAGQLYLHCLNCRRLAFVFSAEAWAAKGNAEIKANTIYGQATTKCLLRYKASEF